MTVIEEYQPTYINGKIRYICKCKCDCGNIKDINYYSLTRGLTQSCGCLHRKITSERNKKYNKYDLSNGYGIGYTSKGEEFYFDLEDYDRIKDYCWFLDKDGYPRARMRNENNNIKVNLLSRYIMDVLDNNTIFVDHKNGIIIDNRKDNLRLVSKLQNNMNRKPRNNIISGVNRVGNKWMATLTYKGEFVLRKCFSTKNKAIQARLEAENEYYGQYSYHNSRNIQT